MFIYICQNHVKIDKLDHVERSKEELSKELEDIKNYAKGKFANIQFFTNEDRTEESSKVNIKKKALYNIGLDLSILSCFGDDDLIIFSPYHYEDRFCNLVQQAAQFYGIKYEVMK